MLNQIPWKRLTNGWSRWPHFGQDASSTRVGAGNSSVSAIDPDVDIWRVSYLNPTSDDFISLTAIAHDTADNLSTEVTPVYLPIWSEMYTIMSVGSSYRTNAQLPFWCLTLRLAEGLCLEPQVASPAIMYMLCTCMVYMCAWPQYCWHSAWGQHRFFQRSNVIAHNLEQSSLRDLFRNLWASKSIKQDVRNPGNHN